MKNYFGLLLFLLMSTNSFAGNVEIWKGYISGSDPTAEIDANLDASKVWIQVGYHNGADDGSQAMEAPFAVPGLTLDSASAQVFYNGANCGYVKSRDFIFKSQVFKANGNCKLYFTTSQYLDVNPVTGEGSPTTVTHLWIMTPDVQN
jgi:hypothetical protein